jgi:hypothetical protein
MVCFNIISKSFGGRYVNFGVFSLYGDKAFDVTLGTMYELMLSIPFDDLLVSYAVLPCGMTWHHLAHELSSRIRSFLELSQARAIVLYIVGCIHRRTHDESSGYGLEYIPLYHAGSG